jgi:hypothetical protein
MPDIILNDLSPAATFIAYNYNTPVDVAEFKMEATRILEECEKELVYSSILQADCQYDLQSLPACLLPGCR